MSRKKRSKNKAPEEAQATSAEATAPIGNDSDDLENRDSRDRVDDVQELATSGDAASTATENTDEETGLDAADPDEAPSERDAEIERLVAEAQEMRLLAQRKQAEFENYRKRIERERAEVVRDATANAVREILPVLDNLERAVEAAKATDRAGEDRLREGVEIICNQFKDALVRQGVTEVEAAEAAFDPHVHEAVGRVETDEYPEGTVVEVLQKGYSLKDRLLRPAMVSVSSPADEAVPQNE